MTCARSFGGVGRQWLAPFATVVALFVVAPRADAQGRRLRDPVNAADAERAVRDRVYDWFEDRAPSKVWCQRCSGYSPLMATCVPCEGTGLNLQRIAKRILPKYLRPAAVGDDLESWFRRAMKQGGSTWLSIPFACLLRIEQILACRDVAWVTIHHYEDQSVRTTEAWTKENGRLFLGHSGPREQLVSDPWFLSDTFSVLSFSDHLERLWEPEEREHATDLERDRAREAREAAEQELRGRTVADRGLVVNVARAATEDGTTAYDVTVWAGFEIHVEVVPGPVQGESARRTEERLATLTKGATVVFRGRPQRWTRAPLLLPTRLDLSHGQVRLDPEARTAPEPEHVQPPR